MITQRRSLLATRHSPSRTRAAAPAFTLMEVMLAGALGLIVIFAAMAFFTTMDRAKKLQQDRLEANAEMAITHKVIQQAFRSLLMSDATNVRDEDQKDKITRDIRDAEDHPNTRDPDLSKVRLAIQPDLGAVTSDGRPTQSLELTLMTPPIHAVSMLSETEQEDADEVRQLLMVRRRQLHLWDGANSRSSSSSSASAEGKDRASSSGSLSSSSSSHSTPDNSADADAQRQAARADRLRAAATGLTGKDADPTALDQAASREMEAPRAPGIRGVFELRPEDDPKVLARLQDANGSSMQGSAMALWWRQIPLDDGLAGEDADGNPITDPQLLELARRSRADGPQIKLLTGLRDAHWQAYRRRKMVSKMTATQAKELPAYIEFQFETVGGRREDWLFEVSWFYGPDPGTIMASNDILANPADALAGANGIPGVGGLPGDLQNLINQAVNQGTGGANGSGTGTGTTAGAAGGKGNSIGGNVGSQSGRPVAQGGSGSGNGSGSGSGNSGGGIPGGGANGATQAEIDAILRQFGFRR